MSDPFRHVPELRGRLIDPERSKARVTADVLAHWDARVIELGGAPDWRLPDAEREASRQVTLAAFRDANEFWVFAYGSLMWDPAFYFNEIRRARLSGFKRCFNYQVMAGRGTPTQPGLVLSLMADASQVCHGLAFRIDKSNVEAESTLLWRREMLRGGYQPIRAALATPQGHCDALVFVGHPTHPVYNVGLSADETAAVIAAAEGHLGPNRDYLFMLSDQLSALGLQDPYVADLHQRVARLVTPQSR
jgi:cation transport protein ChaC